MVPRVPFAHPTQLLFPLAYVPIFLFEVSAGFWFLAKELTVPSSNADDQQPSTG